MKQKQLLLFGALGVGAYLLLSGKLGGTGGTGGGRMFTLPNGQSVPESQLPSLGYVQYEGQWYLASQLQPPNVPAGTSPNSQTWMDYVNAALQTGQQLFVLGGELGSAIAQVIKSTAVDWPNNSVTVRVSYGYLSYNGVVTPTTNITKPYSDQQIVITGSGTQAIIKLIKAGQVVKQATIDFANKKLIGFSAGSVGITGVYIGSAYSNIDTVTSMYGIGALKGKGSRAKNQYNREVDAYKYFVLNLETGRLEAGYEYKGDAEDAANDYNNAKVVSLRQIKQMGIADPRASWKYIEGIGSIYDYNHPKGLTHCQDGTYSDAAKGACSYHGGAHEIKLRKGMRDYTGKGKYDHYMSYRKDYKNNWAKKNRASQSDRIVTL